MYSNHSQIAFGVNLIPTFAMVDSSHSFKSSRRVVSSYSNLPYSLNHVNRPRPSLANSLRAILYTQLVGLMLLRMHANSRVFRATCCLSLSGGSEALRPSSFLSAQVNSVLPSWTIVPKGHY